MFNQKDTIQIAFNFALLGEQKQKIIKLLNNQKNGVFVGNYTDLTKELGLKTGSCGSQTNIRRALLELEELNIVTIERDGKWWEVIKLKKDWLNVLRVV